MKPYIILIGIIVIFIIIDILLTYKEGINDTDKELMLQYVQKYPNTYSVDPLYESKFKPECCPNMYTSSTGCLCIDKENYSLIHSRGGNSYGFQYATHPTPDTQYLQTN
jgi:hypothetical protein